MHNVRKFQISKFWKRFMAVVLGTGIVAFTILGRNATSHTFDPVTDLTWTGLWLADSGITPNASNSSTRVTTWVQVEGVGTPLTRSSGTYQPVRQVTVTAFNGQVGIDFSATQCLGRLGTQPTGTTGYWIAYVIMDAANSINQVFGISAGSGKYLNGDIRFLPGDGSGPILGVPGIDHDDAFGDPEADEVYTSNFVPSINTAYILEFWADGAYHIAVDGDEKTLAVNGGSNSGKWAADIISTVTNVGGNSASPSGNCVSGIDGKIGVIGYMDGSIPTTQQRTDLRQWILYHWAAFGGEPTATPTITATATATATATPTTYIEDKTESFLDDIGFGGDSGKQIFALGTILGLAVVLAFLRVNKLVALGMLGVWSGGMAFTGFLPGWLVLGAIAVAGIGIAVWGLTAAGGNGDTE